MVTYLRFRRALEYNQMLHVLPCKSSLQPYGTCCMLAIITFLTLTNGFQIFFSSEWNVSNFLAAYITIRIFLVLYLGHKIFCRTRFLIPVSDIDVVTGKKEMDELEAMDRPPIPRNGMEKA
jgi:amino acid transporter